MDAIDRGGDRGVLYKKYLKGRKAKRFVIRLVDRDLIHQDRRRSCLDLAKVLPTPYETALIVYEEGKEKKRTIQYNAIPVKLPSYEHRLYLVVVKGFGVEPMILLTSCAVKIHRKESVWRIVEYYLARVKYLDLFIDTGAPRKANPFSEPARIMFLILTALFSPIHL